MRIPHAATAAFALLSVLALTIVSANTNTDEDPPRRQLSETVPFSSWASTKHAVQYILAFLMVLLAAHPIGVLFPRYAKLPLITGYLIVGIVAGPFVANLLPSALVAMLAPSVNALALAFISFQAGQEIYLPELKPQIKSILTLLVVLYGVTMTILTSVLFFLNSPFFYDAFDGACQLAIALMFGSIAVLGSPATVMAIKIELNSVGPFTNLMLGATMTAEFVVLVSFSVSRVVSSIYCAKLDISFANLMFTLGVVLANLLIGAAISLLIIAIFLIPGGPEHSEESAELLAVQDRASHQGTSTTNAQHYLTRSRSSRASMRRLSGLGKRNLSHSTSSFRADMESGGLQSTGEEDNMPHPHNAYIEVDDVGKGSKSLASPVRRVLGSVLEWLGSLYGKGFLWLLAGYAFYLSTNTISEATIHAYGHSWDVKFEPLLVLMTASCLAGHYSSIRHDMHVILDTAAPYIFLPFFVMTGAALKLDQVADAIPLMSLYVILRYVSIFVACYVGGRFVLKLEPREYNNLWLTMTPQAGVALGLANEVKGLSDDPWAAEFAATIVAAVVVNQIIGPVLCAIGLSRAGESYASRMAKVAEDNAVAAAAAAMLNATSGGGGGGAVELVNGLPKVDENHTLVIQDNGDPRPLLPFYKVNQAVVIGEDEMAFEVALELSLYGAHVNVPLLDEELAAKWQRINETILARSAKGELIKFKNTMNDAASTAKSGDLPTLASSTDVVIFTGDADRSLEHAKTMLATFGGKAKCPRLIAVVPDCTYAKQLKDLGVLTIQPSIAMANIATRMALLELDLAQQLSNEISTTSNFSTATYFMRHDSDRDSVHSLSELRLPGRRLALGRSVVNHHNVEYDTIAEALTSVNLPPPPPPARVSMFGTTAPDHNPFAARPGGLSVYEHYAVDEADLVDDYDREVFTEQFLPSPANSTGGGFERGRSLRRSSRGSTRRLRRSRSGSASSGGYGMTRTNSARV